MINIGNIECVQASYDDGSPVLIGLDNGMGLGTLMQGRAYFLFAEF